ncbi:acetyltransferase [Vibrio cholerae]|nr:acetyltransferase [Vibrio cholerae]EGR4051597.1 acetyltransferase [Vibrio cholerae]TXZ48077.1 acetyltransferase [Vibrio cholerae]
MVSVVVFEFSVMRCQPLRRALALFRNTPNPREGKCTN